MNVESNHHETKIFKYRFLIVVCAAAAASLSAMTPELEEGVREWIDTYVLAEGVNPNDYWQSTVKLGSSISQETADRLKALQTYSVEEANALMAFEVAQNPKQIKGTRLHDINERPEAVEELGWWYGRPENQLPYWKLRTEVQGMPRHGGHRPIRLRDEHQTEEYRTAWQAWLLSPRWFDGWREKDLMMPRLRRAVFELPHPSTVPITVLAAEALNLPQPGEDMWSEFRSSEWRLGKSLNYLGILRMQESKDGVLGMLRLYHLAENEGYADAGVEKHGDMNHYGRYIERALASRNFYTMDKILADEKKWSAPATGSGGYVVDERWKTFKPIIQELLADPEAYDLQEIDIELLQNALRLMPDAPFPGKDQ